MVREDDLYRGMTVVGPDDRPLGKVDHIVKDTETREARSISVGGRLVPLDNVKSVEDGRVHLDVGRDGMARFPIRDEAMPAQTQPDHKFEALGMRSVGYERYKDRE